MKAKAMTKTIRISDIIIDPEINTRAIDTETVQEYKESIEGYGADWQNRWAEHPRITKSNHLWSGAHTVTAAKLVFRMPNDTIEVVIEGEDKRDAYFLATRCNAQHGRRRSNAEKQEAVDRWLEDPVECSWTDGHIAKMCNVSAQFVSNRRSLATIASQTTKRRFINAVGKIEWIETGKIGTNQAADDDKKQRKTEFDEYIKHRDNAYSLWRSFCLQWKVDSDWESFCLYAEEHLNGRGCVTAIDPEKASLELIQERKDTWIKMHEAIKGKANWIISYHLKLEHQEYEKRKGKKEAEEPEEDNQRKHLMLTFERVSSEVIELYNEGLGKKMDWEDLVGYAQEMYPTFRDDIEPVDESDDDLDEQIRQWRSVRAAIKYVLPFIDADTEPTDHWLLKRVVKNPKPVREPLQIKPAEKPIESTNVGIVFAAHNEAKEAYRKLLDNEEAVKDNEPYWDDFCATAKENAPRGKGMPRGKHDGMDVDRYEKSKSEHIVEAWEWIAQQCEEPPQWVCDWLKGVVETEQAKAASDTSGATDMMLSGYIDDCQTSIENLLATDGIPLILKYPAEALLEAIKKHLLVKENQSE